MNTSEVVIVGAGPSGLMVGLDLMMQGISCTILERRGSIASNLTRVFSGRYSCGLFGFLK